MKLDFDVLLARIDNRKNAIYHYRQKLVNVVTINGGNLVVDPDCEKEAAEIMDLINHQKREIIRGEKFIELGRRLVHDHGIPLSGEKAFVVGSCDIGALIEAEKALQEKEAEPLRQQFMSGNITDVDYRKKLQLISEPHEKRIEELSDVIKELEEF